ncbi:MAG: Hsp20/alpha crystallin family protein [Bacteroidota bacterium]|nr:Hsp20/alpha crystallin family protein [Bacteroidota bacterium]
MLPMIRRSSLPDLVDEFFGRDFMGNFDDQTGVNMPAVNIVEDKNEFSIEVAAPGLDKNDFNIDLDHNVLTISSEKKDEKKEDNKKFMRREFSYTSFKRSFTLPNTVKADKISATHKDGVLSISIPKKEEAKEKPPRQIKIS